MANEKSYIKLAKTNKCNSALTGMWKSWNSPTLILEAEMGLSPFGEDLVKGCTLQLLISVNLEKDSYPIKNSCKDAYANCCIICHYGKLKELKYSPQGKGINEKRYCLNLKY